MQATKELKITGFQYELDISIQSDATRIWTALVEETNRWWLADFRMVDPSSEILFEPEAGGGLIEKSQSSGSLLWYTVHYILPQQYVIYLTGQLAADFGGPGTTHLKWSLHQQGEGSSSFKLQDSLVGHVQQATVDSLKTGWTQLFTDGLKAYVEEV